MRPALLICLTVLPVFCASELVFLQAAWRHGDRTPTWTCKADPHKEDAWQRFGGYGELTATGMEQHIRLGDLMYQKYAVEEGFLSKKFNPKEIYIRSTDINRTMISATSNMIGMYYGRGNTVAGDDYPDGDVKWPGDYVPVPIHTVRNIDDYVANPDATCERQNWLWNRLVETEVFQKFKAEHQDLVDRVSAVCQQPIDLVDDLWKVKDSFKIERIYNLTLLVNETEYQNILSVNNRVEDLQNGLDIDNYKGINFRIEIGKIRAGTLLWDMIAHMDLKLRCLDQQNADSVECNWMKHLKYYAYSAHDTTVGALLAVLNAKTQIIKSGGYPEYSSAVVIELHRANNTNCIKFLFHRDFSATFDDITSIVEGCENTVCCPYELFRYRYKKFYPSRKEYELCNDLSSFATYFDPDAN